MSKKLKAAVIGLGVGEQHLIGYIKNSHVEVSAVCDIDEKKLREVSNKYSIAKIFTCWKKLLCEDLDIVSICSYDNYHAVQTCLALENGINCMVEKPIALNRKEAEKILIAYKKSKCILTSNLILRESQRFKLLKKKISAGKYGKIVTIEADYLHNILWKIKKGWRGSMMYYSTVFGGGIHLIDLARWILNKEVKEVFCISNNVQTQNSSYKFDDFFCSLLKFENETILKSTTNFGSIRNKFHSLNIYGTKATYINELPDGYFFDSFGDDVKPKFDQTPYKSTIDKFALIDNFVDSVRGKKKCRVSVEDVFRVMDICFAIMESNKKRKLIKVNYSI